MNAETNQDIPGAFDCLPYICENDAVLVNIRAETMDQVKSVRLGIVGPVSKLPRVENAAPWALFGDINGIFNGVVLKPGSYNMTAEPFSETYAQGKAGEIMSMQFQVPSIENGNPDELPNEPSTTPSAVPSFNPSDSPSLKPSDVPSTFPSGNPSYSPTPEPIDILLRWGFCSGRECQFYIQNIHPSDEYIITSMTIDWPQSPSTGRLPDLRQVRQGSVRLWKKEKGTTPAPAYEISSDQWQTGTTDERLLSFGGQEKEYLVRFDKNANLDTNVSLYTIQVALQNLSEPSKQITVVL